ncbi:MAG: hypothetical protein ACLPWF_23985 [Bryobacteraceae bacterium]
MSDQDSPDQDSSDQHTLEGQVERAKRLREHIESLKSGRPIETPEHPKSLREQIDERTDDNPPNPAGEWR